MASAMPVVEALQVLIGLCGDGWTVVTNQGSARIWPALSRRPTDFHYNPSTMGGAIPLALGLALAQPEREVLAVTGDGSLLMSLGSLVTVAGSGVKNLTVVLLDNGIYEVTGGQKTAATGLGVDYPALAKAAGLTSVADFAELASWQANAASFFKQPGPRFVSLAVQAAPRELIRAATPPLAEQLSDLQQALQS